jgi:uncharacterized protein YnzC (UPF0291/DUF896 family)
MDAQYYARFNELIDKLAADNMTENEKKEYKSKRNEILNEKISATFQDKHSVNNKKQKDYC